jgi:hypothetical protein
MPRHRDAISSYDSRRHENLISLLKIVRYWKLLKRWVTMHDWLRLPLRHISTPTLKCP